MNAAIDRFGRILIPKGIRERLGLKPGSFLRIEEGEGEIVLRPVDREPHVVLEGLVLVFTGKAKGNIMRAVRAAREERTCKTARRTIS